MDVPLVGQLEALQLLKSEDFEDSVDEESKDEAQREKDAMADRLILMYGGGDVGAPPHPIDSLAASPIPPHDFQADLRHPMKSQRSSLQSSRRYQQQPAPRTRGRPTRSGDVLESRPHVFTATEKDFSPRILNKPKVASKLSQSKHYYRPKPKPPIKPSMLAGNDGHNWSLLSTFLVSHKIIINWHSAICMMCVLKLILL